MKDSQNKKNRKSFSTILIIISILIAVILFCGFLIKQDNNKVSAKYERQADLAGNYLINATTDSGKFIYKYDPLEDVNMSGYNVLRHAGTIYAMSELYQKTSDESLRASLDKSVTYLMDQTKKCSTDTDFSHDYLCLVEDQEIKLGGNALAVLALTKYSQATLTNKYDNKIKLLSDWIIAIQNPDGEFRIHKTSSFWIKDSGFVSEYYPGEAIYALAVTAEWLEIPEYLTSAELAAYWLTEVRDADIDVENLTHDHWLLYGLRELYKGTQDSFYQEQSKRYAQAIIQAQRKKVSDGEPEFWIGTFNTPPRSAPTSTKMEGLVAAYNTSKISDIKYRKKLRSAIKAGMTYIINTQITLHTANQLPNPAKATGGVIGGENDRTIRIDYVQHALSAFLGAIDVLR